MFTELATAVKPTTDPATVDRRIGCFADPRRWPEQILVTRLLVPGHLIFERLLLSSSLRAGALVTPALR